MNAHAFLPPSGSDAWRWCSLWPTMNAKYPDTGGHESQEGDAAHWVNLQRPLAAVGERAPNGVAVTEEMRRGAELWASVVPEHARPEETCPPAFHPHNWGTPDAWYFDGSKLTVYDYKFGHKLIEVFENWQLINYAALIMAAIGIDDLRVMCEFVIVQPRGFHRDGPVRRWNVGPLSNLRGHINQLREAAARATSPEHIKGTVGAHCKYCPGRHACDALQRNVYVSMDTVGSSIPLELSPEALGQEAEAVRRSLAMMEARYEGLKEQLRSVMMRGQRVPLWQLSESNGREIWTVPVDQVKAIAGVFGHTLTREEICTPQQARQMGVPVAIVNALSTKPRGELQPKPDDGSMLRQLFGN